MLTTKPDVVIEVPVRPCVIVLLLLTFRQLVMRGIRFLRGDLDSKPDSLTRDYVVVHLLCDKVPICTCIWEYLTIFFVFKTKFDDIALSLFLNIKIY